MSRLIISLTCLAILILTGCNESADQTSNGSQNPESVTKSTSDSTKDGEQKTAVPAEDPEWAKENTTSPEEQSPAQAKPFVEVTFESVDETGYAEKIAELKGKVILVDFWATWCIPCRKSFPHTIELAHQHADQGLAVISVSLDEEEEAENIQKFLEQHQADIINLRSIYGAEDPSFEKFELGTTGLPHYKLYARDGTVVKTFAVPEEGDAVDSDEIDQAVEAELAK